MCNDHNQREVSLKNKERHQEDHNNWSRRGFLQTLGLASGAGMMMGGFSVSALASSSLLPMIANAGIDDRILVLIRLKGGNDGLNTIIPLFDYSKYSEERPTIKIPQSDILSLDNDNKFGIPKTMTGIKSLWDNGAMKVINSVGYEDHNLSHFNSTDIWNSGDQNYLNAEDQSGWLGRYILDQNPNYLEELPSVPGAIKISSGSAVAFHNPDQIDLAVNFNSPDRLLDIAESGFVYDTVNLPDDCYYGDQIGFLRGIMNVTFSYAPQISTAYGNGTNEVSYSNNELSRQLSIVARLIKGNLGTRLYMVTLDGFDTHENQNNSHPNLMNTLSNAVTEFYADLTEGNKAQEVLSMTFSEFGRRINENSGGTDHGTAAPVMMFGPALQGNAILGKDPDLDDIDNNGNLKHDIDFRSIYATILESWLCLDPVGVDMILGDSYERISGIGFDCMSVSTQEVTPLEHGIKHLAKSDGMGGIIIEYTLDRPGPVEISIFSVMGQKVTTLVSEYQLKGKHQAHYNTRFHGTSTAPLIYRIVNGGKQYSGKFVVAS